MIDLESYSGGGWTIRDMLREQFAGNHCSELGRFVYTITPFYVTTPGDPPLVTLDRATMRHEVTEGDHPGPRSYHITPRDDDPSHYGYDVTAVGSIPAGEPRIGYVFPE